jgi:uncharacterized membrane protein YjjP (DUF1212 family)|tara:strand:+ start:444 stop:668 length:225 start_codon:yes stop_codon:yes gene_type:complete
MFDFDENLIFALLIYLGSCYLFYQLKHTKMFTKEGQFKSFGLSKNETTFPYWLVTTMIGLFSYYLLVMKKTDYM